MALIIHLFLHTVASFVIGLIVWKGTQTRLISFLGALIGGVLIDLDHFFDYFLAFGPSFNLSYFLNGYEFLKSDRAYILFHGFEYVLILLTLSLFIKKKASKAFIIALGLGILSHLIIDIGINNMNPPSYFFLNRAKNNFDLQKLISPEKWPQHNLRREKLIFL